jgi:hypothetical protein
MSTLLMFILGGVMRWETFISFPMIIVTKVAKWGEKTEQKENETASPQNIKSKLNVLCEIVLDCFQNTFFPNHSRLIHVCIFQRQRHLAEQTKAPLRVCWFESKF